MTMMQALKIHGVDAPRFVSALGAISIGEGGGSGMRLPSHTFHGGEEPKDDVSAPRWWHDETLLTREREEMSRWFPGFLEVPPEDGEDRPPVWFGSLDNGISPQKVIIAHRFDHALPAVIPMKKPAPRRNPKGGWHAIPHYYVSGNLCVASAEDWDPEAMTAAAAIAWAAHWFACHKEWLLHGEWPAEGVPSAA
jgi:hypothetical protein